MAKVLGLHAIELKPGVDESEFESFMTREFAPVYARKPGQVAYLMKGDRGEQKGKYLFVIEIESPERRDEIWPREGETWTVSEEFRRVIEGAGAIGDRLDTFVTQFPGQRFTDYVVVTG